jgi:hypothetical protein
MPLAPRLRMTETTRHCKHETCGCPVDDVASGYCSAYCANVAANADHAAEEDSACACGHDGCAVALDPPAEGSSVSTSIGGLAPRDPHAGR